MWPFTWKPKISETINSFELIKRLQVIAPSDCSILCRDTKYLIPANPADIMKRSPAKRYEYEKESRDCEDFVRITRGWLSQKNLGNLLCIDCKIKLYNGDRHALCAFLVDDKIVFGAPQTGKMVRYNNVKIERLIA